MAQPSGSRGDDGIAGVRAELAAAVRAVNAAYARLPANRRPDPAPFDPLDAEVDAAFASGDREHAMAAISAWRRYWLSRFEEAGP